MAKLPRYLRRLLLTLAAVVLTLTIGTTGFVLIEGYPVFDAFYMSLITITTVGYKEVHDLSTAGRIFNAFLIFFGVSTLLLAIGAMTQMIIEFELSGLFGKRQVRRMIDKLTDHYIVCGYGRAGRGAAGELQRAGAPFVVIDNFADRVERAMRNGMLAVQADATSDQVLRDVGVGRAKGLIATLSTDADNLYLVLSAKTLNPSLHVSARVLEEESEHKMRRAGADAVLAPYNIAGIRLAQAILRPHVIQFLDLTTMNMELNVAIEQLYVDQNSEFVSKSLKQMQIRRDLGIIVLAIRKKSGEMVFNPDPEVQIAAGDYLIAMGEPERLSRLESLLSETRV